MAKEKSGYYGQRRKFWSWGYEGEANSKDEIRTMRDRVEQRLGIKDIEILSDPTLDEIELYASRIKIPRTLEDFCTSEKWDRIVHTYGKGFKDMTLIYRRDFKKAPDVVAYPRDEEDIAAIFDWCGENSYACIPYGGGSSVTGGFWGPERDAFPGVVVIDLGNLNKILEVDPVSRCARIQAGILGPALEEQLKPHGLTLRHIPQSWEFSSLGGWIATRSSGHYATHLTHIDDMVESLRVVTPAGTIQNRRLPGSGAGPNPDRLFIGSEGSLGIITDEASTAGETVAVELLGAIPGTIRAVAAGAVSAGEAVYTAASGRVQSLPSAAGTYYQVGVSLTAAAASGDEIEIITCVPRKLVVEQPV